MKRLAIFLLNLMPSIVLGAGAYPYFQPGGALTGTWNSQNVNLASGPSFIFGDLPDGNLSSNVPLLDSINVWLNANTFTLSRTNAIPSVLISSTVPGLRWQETDATAQNGLWEITASGESFRVGAVLNDSGSTIANALLIDRTGTTIDSIAATATAYTWNGSTLWSAGNDGAGSGLNADLLDGLSSAAFAQLASANIFTANQTISKSDPRFCIHDTVEDFTFFERSTAGVWRLYAVDGSVCTTTGAVIPITVTTVAGTTTSINFSSTALTSGGSTIWTAANDGTGSGLDADLLDGLSSAAFAQLAQSNTFTGNTQVISNASGPRVVLDDVDAGADQRCWFTASQSGLYTLYAATDANCNVTTGASTALQFNRTGVTVTSAALTSTAFTWNSSTVWSAGNDGTGSGLDADLLDGLNNTAYAQVASTASITGTWTWTTGIPAFNGGTSGVSAPFSVDSTQLVTNLNADLLDGLSSSAFASSSVAPANPTASVGLTAVNGSAVTYMRSDAAPALSVSIVPTWSGIHTFNAIPAFNGGTSGASAPFTVDSTQVVTNLNADTLDALSSAAFAQVASTASITGTWTFTTGIPAFNGGTSGASAPFSVDSTQVVTNLNADLLDGSSASAFPTLAGGGNFTTAPTINSATIATQESGTQAMTQTGCSGSPSSPSVRWVRTGNVVTLELPTVTCTSNSTAWSWSGLPASIRPPNGWTGIPLACIIDNAVQSCGNGAVAVDSAGVISFLRNASTTGWTNSGTKNLAQFTSVSYGVL